MKKKLLMMLSAIFIVAFTFSPTAHSAGKVTYSGNPKTLTVYLGYSFEANHPGITSLKACLISDRLGRDYLNKDANPGNNAYCVPFEREANRNTFFRWFDRQLNYEAPVNDLYINDNPQVLVVWTQSGVKKTGVLSLAGYAKTVGAGLALTIDAHAGVNRVLYGRAGIGYKKPTVYPAINPITGKWVLVVNFGADGLSPPVSKPHKLSKAFALEYFTGYYSLTGGEGKFTVDPNTKNVFVVINGQILGTCGSLMLIEAYPTTLWMGEFSGFSADANSTQPWRLSGGLIARSTDQICVPQG